MADGITIRIDDAQVRAALAAMAARLGNMHDVMDDIGVKLVNLARAGFLAERAPDGTPWKPLAASTILARTRRKTWPGVILRVSGSLMRSINSQATADAVEIGAGWGNSSAYAAIHLFGGRVLRPMRRGVLRFKVDMETGRSRFASKSKANFEQDATFGGKPTVIPARPYLPTSGPLPDAWIASCLDIISQHLEAAARG
ncbi:MAG: phage virion morphogenesis protein [Desulfovibrionaceae bacterium]